ncbi:NADH-quinone oxidoreductase subunit NuoE [Gorillibacterium massiliense]|uniref:NADH-quinone oxidoreductase subunit NuoE n=1 Tax=Gorillibacterium massiliense TaxID=1280390 RepID=UPI0004BBBEE0|nr:NADH-quinone oxidoreductase subunit NuoE [Gorillibacterium massiliense]
MADQQTAQPSTCCCGGEKTDEKLEKVKAAIENLKGLKGALIPVLHEVQDIYGYLPEDVLKLVSAELKMSLAEIYGVATFYSFFSLTPKGEHVIRVCMGTACYIKGAQGLLDRLSQELNVPVNGTTADNKFTLDATRCLGACGLAPVLTIGEKVYGRLTPNDVPKILKEYK